MGEGRQRVRDTLTTPGWDEWVVGVGGVRESGTDSQRDGMQGDKSVGWVGKYRSTALWLQTLAKSPQGNLIPILRLLLQRVQASSRGQAQELLKLWDKDLKL